jgi:hypothetical protein
MESAVVTVMQKQYSKADVQKMLLDNTAQVSDHPHGKSAIWELFGDVCKDSLTLSGHVACKACKKVYIYQSSDGTQSLENTIVTLANRGRLLNQYMVQVNQVLTGPVQALSRNRRPYLMQQKQK